MTPASRSRFAVTISTMPSAIQQQAIALMQETPGIADVRVGQDQGRPELAIRVDGRRPRCSA